MDHRPVIQQLDHLQVIQVLVHSQVIQDIQAQVVQVKLLESHPVVNSPVNRVQVTHQVIQNNQAQVAQAKLLESHRVVNSPINRVQVRNQDIQDHQSKVVQVKLLYTHRAVNSQITLQVTNQVIQVLNNLVTHIQDKDIRILDLPIFIHIQDNPEFKFLSRKNPAALHHQYLLIQLSTLYLRSKVPLSQIRKDRTYPLIQE